MEIELLDGRILRGLVGAYNRAIEKYPKIESRITKKYDRLTYDGLKQIADNAIDDFYNSYDGGPHVYRRKKDLYNAYQITSKDGERYIDVDSQYMKKSHNQDNDLIYNVTMKVGAHGGSPHNGDYYWRWPSPREAARLGVEPYSEWFDTPAKRGPSDTEGRILSESQEYVENMFDEEQKEFNAELRLIVNDLKDRVRRLFSMKGGE